MPQLETGITPPWIKSDEFFETYGNMLHIMWSLDDVRLRFAQLIPDPTTPNPGTGMKGAAEERAAISVSWRVAKILRDQLDIAIKSWESVNGEIKTEVQLPMGQ